MEAIRPPPQEIVETACPACGTSIGTASIGRRRRVQCPKCREVVDVGAAQKPSVQTPKIVPTAAGKVSESSAKIEALEARIAALEEALVKTAEARPIEITIFKPERRWKWIARSEDHDAEKLPQNLEEVFMHNLSNYDGHPLKIRATAGNARALARANGLKEMFKRAQWTIQGPEDVTPRNTEKGLFLAVGGLPLPPAAAAAYFAMTVSGFSVQSFLDPRLAGNETVLIVA